MAMGICERFFSRVVGMWAGLLVNYTEKVASSLLLKAHINIFLCALISQAV